MSANESSFLLLSNRKRRKLPSRFRDDDVRYTEALVEHFLTQFTRRGAKVLDPFAGFGTTMLVAERMGRQAFGVEYDPQRTAYIKSLMRRPERVIQGDSRKIDLYEWPKFDFCMTSPPYTACGETENPFTSYSTRGRGYKNYLRDLSRIYRRIARLMKPRSPLVVEIANIKSRDSSKPVTTLAWDVAAVLSEILDFQGEIVIGWKGGYAYGFDHSYCLVFRTRGHD